MKKVVTYRPVSKLKERTREQRRKTDEVQTALMRRVLFCRSELEVDASVTLARVLSATGVTNTNYLLFLRFLETNNSFVVDSLIGFRNPLLMFTPIRPNWYLMKETFRILARYKREEMYERALYPLMGIIQNAYKKGPYGYSIYPLSISDIYSIGKYLDKSQGQENLLNRFILDLLFDLYQVGIDSVERRPKQVAIAANAVRMAFFDDLKKLSDAIPDVLLIREDRTRTEVRPGLALEAAEASRSAPLFPPPPKPSEPPEPPEEPPTERPSRRGRRK